MLKYFCTSDVYVFVTTTLYCLIPLSSFTGLQVKVTTPQAGSETGDLCEPQGDNPEGAGGGCVSNGGGGTVVMITGGTYIVGTGVYVGGGLYVGVGVAVGVGVGVSTSRRNFTIRSSVRLSLYSTCRICSSSCEGQTP